MLYKLIKKIGVNFFRGLIGLLPITIVFLIVGFLFGLIHDGIGLVIENTHSELILYILVATVIVITLIGYLIEKKERVVWIVLSEIWLSKFPLIGKVVSTIKGFTEMITGEGKFKDLGVAKVPFGGATAYALITNHDSSGDSVEYTVFIVQGTFPPVGLVCFYDEKDVVIQDDMTPADVFKLQISLGID